MKQEHKILLGILAAVAGTFGIIAGIKKAKNPKENQKENPAEQQFDREEKHFWENEDE